MKQYYFIAALILLSACNETKPCRNTLSSDYRFDVSNEVCAYCLQTKAHNQPGALALKTKASTSFDAGRFDEAAQLQLEFLETGVSGYPDIINLSLYLKKAGRLEESLKYALDAKGFDEYDGIIQMRTQFHLGWSYLVLGRYDEAIEALTLGIHAQTDFSFAYLRRGMAYDSKGESHFAARDFDDFVKFFKLGQAAELSDDEKASIRQVLAKYRIESPLI